MCIPIQVKIFEVLGHPLPSIEQTCSRLIEEFVELCLAGGMKPESILLQVSEALQKEANKLDVYLSDVEPNVNVNELVGEMADVIMQLEWLQHIAKISDKEIEEHLDTKKKSVIDNLQINNLKIKKGAVYRIKRIPSDRVQALRKLLGDQYVGI